MIGTSHESSWPRRTFLTGAIAAGIGTVIAGRLPQAMAAGAPAAGEAFKLISIVRRRSDLSAAQFYDYWLNRHGPLATQAITELGGFRYVQSHLDTSQLTSLLRASRGQADVPYDGITEVWFPSEEALMAAMSTPAGTQANLRLEMDEPNFIDLPASSYFFSREHLFLGAELVSDRSLTASIGAVRFVRVRSGSRRLDVRISTNRAVSARALLLRGSSVLGHARVADAERLSLRIDDAISGGDALLEIVVQDSEGRSGILRQRVRIPKRAS